MRLTFVGLPQLRDVDLGHLHHRWQLHSIASVG
jgi:hypothetical protein